MCSDADAKPRCPSQGGPDREKTKLDYLTRQYGYYTTHMNQVFNFYLVAAALIATAFVQSLSGARPMETAGSQAIVVGGALLSLVFWLLHMRGFQIAGLLDDELAEVEGSFGVRFMKDRKKSQLKPFTNTTLFSLIYIGFIGAFIFAACQAPHWRNATDDSPRAALGSPLP